MALLPEFSEARFLHSTGFIQLCRDSDPNSAEKRFLTCGIDGDVWLWDSENVEDGDSDAKRISDRTHNSLAWHGKNVYIGQTLTDFLTNIEKQVVGWFEFPNFSANSPIVNFSLDISALDISPSGQLIVAGGSDFALKCIDVANPSRYRRYECEGPVLSVAIDPKEQYFASSSTDGCVRIWDVFEQHGECSRENVKTMQLFPSTGDILSLN